MVMHIFIILLNLIAVDISQSPQRKRQNPPISVEYAIISSTFENTESES
jgi:hypothetical protein